MINFFRSFQKSDFNLIIFWLKNPIITTLFFDFKFQFIIKFMYPKSSLTLNKSTDSKKQAKREQLANLLINKFRNKYQINPVTERKLDEMICE